MGDVSRPQSPALLAEDPRLSDPSESLWPAESSYNEAGPTAGQPDPQGDYLLVLQARGDQPSEHGLEIVAQEGASVDRSGRSGTFRWREAGDTATIWRGWETPHLPVAWEAIEWTDTDSYLYPHAVVTKNSVVVVATVETTGGNDNIVVHRRVDGVWGAAVSVQDETTLGQTGSYPCLLVAEDRLFLFHWFRPPAAQTPRYIRVHVSTDDGATWAVARTVANEDADIVTQVGLGFTIGSSRYGAGRLRAAYYDGQVLLTAHLKKADVSDCDGVDVLRQWFSADLGMKLQTVDTWVGTSTTGPITNNAAYHDVVVSDGVFVLIYNDGIGGPSTDGSVKVRRIATASTPFSLSAEIDVAAGGADTWAYHLSDTTTRTDAAETADEVTDSDLCAAIDDTGLIWVFVRYANDFWGATDPRRHRCSLGYSDDGGLTWHRVSRDQEDLADDDRSCCWWDTADIGAGLAKGNYPLNFCSVFYKGQVELLHNWFAADGDEDDSLACLYLGGYQTLTMPLLDPAIGFRDRCGFERFYLPIERLQDQTPWTHTTAGVGAGNQLNSPGNEHYFSGDGAGNPGVNIDTYIDATTSVSRLAGTLHVAWHAEANGDRTTDNICIMFRLGDAVAGRWISIRLEGTAFRLVDRGSGATLFDLTGLDDAPYEWRVGMRHAEGGAGVVTLWHRLWDNKDDRIWTFDGTFAVTDDGGAFPSNRVIVGHYANSGDVTITESRRYFGPLFSIDDDTLTTPTHVGQDQQWHSHVADSNPTWLSCKPYAGTWEYVTDDVEIRAVDGPAVAGDEHHIDTKYLFPIENLFLSRSRSPRDEWRDTNETQKTIAVQIDSAMTGADESRFGSVLGFCAVMGANWRTGRVQEYTAAAWATAMNADAASGMAGLLYTRDGGVIVPLGDASLFLTEDELAGYVAEFDNGAGTTVRRVITGNAGGRWSSTWAGPKATVRLDGALPADPAGAGSVNIWSPNFVMVWHARSTVEGLRLLIDAQTTVDGFIRQAKLVFGHVHTLGHPYSFGRISEGTPGVERDEGDDRTGYVTNFAPFRREARISWVDGIRTQSVFDADPQPDYLLSSSSGSGAGMATKAATPMEIMGLVRRLKGAPVFYVDRLDRGPPDEQTINRYRDLALMHIDGAIQVTATRGWEQNNEIVNIATIPLLEEV